MLDGVEYHLTEKPTIVSAEVAEKLHLTWMHLVEITDVPAEEEAKPEELPAEEIVESPKEEITQE